MDNKSTEFDRYQLIIKRENIKKNMEKEIKHNNDNSERNNLIFFFAPNSIAIIGASDSPRFGFWNTKYLLNSKFKTYPVHLYKDKIFGHKAYKNIKDIPDNIDLAIVLVGNESVVQAVKECVDKDVKGIIIETAGFAETGIKNYIKYQKELEEIVKSSKIRIIGPNCVGVTNFYNEFTSSDVDFSKTVKGNIAIIAQSGVLGNVFIDWASVGQKIGFSKIVTLGNKIDVDEIDMIEYFENDPDTKVITIYLEGVKRGNDFIKALKKITKPIIILKNGRSELGSTAIKSHTGSLAGNDRIFDAIFKQYPCIFRVENFYEMFNIAQVFATQPFPRGNNVAIITGSGSIGILACDELERQGLILAKLGEDTIQSMKSVAPDWVSLKNPVDLGPSQMITLNPVLKAIFSDNNVDSVLFLFTVPRLPLEFLGVSIMPSLRLIKNLSSKFKKPCIICVFGSRWVFDFILKPALRFQIPVMNRVKEAILALKMMYEYNQFISSQ